METLKCDVCGAELPDGGERIRVESCTEIDWHLCCECLVECTSGALHEALGL